MISNPILTMSVIATMMLAGILGNEVPNFKEPYPFSDNPSINEDDQNTDAIDAPNGIPVGENTYDKAYVSPDGLITLGSILNTGSISVVALAVIRQRHKFPVLAVYFTDLNSESQGSLYYKKYEQSAGEDVLLERASKEVRYFADRTDFSATWMLVATWDRVQFFNKDSSLTIQAILVTDGESTYAMYNYIDVNVDGLDQNIAIGWSTIETHEEYPQSRTLKALKMSLQPSNTRNPDAKGYLFYTLAEVLPTTTTTPPPTTLSGARDDGDDDKLEKILQVLLVSGVLFYIWLNNPEYLAIY